MKDASLGSTDKMEWITLNENGCPGQQAKPNIHHSTPLSFRPAPTESPNVSIINAEMDHSKTDKTH